MEDKMAQQNIYDDEIFFEGYKKIRDNKINANNLFEIPTLFSMLPDLKNKRILDFYWFYLLLLQSDKFKFIGMIQQ